MSLFRWLFPAKKSKMPAAMPGPARVDSHRAAGGGNAQPSSRKGERMARRELLYGVVRQSMMRAGVLSSGYKFKVLSLDPKGHEFLVMIDLARTYVREAGRLADIEAMIAQAAKARHEILVEGVYWRMNEHVAVGNPAAQDKAAGTPPQPENSHPAALDSGPGALDSAPGGLGADGARAIPRFEPIQADEVAAFKSALAAGVSASAAVAASAPRGAGARASDGSVRRGPQNYTLLTGFEDTELPDARLPVLSGTQYGELS
jgi:hypothetical protein